MTRTFAGMKCIIDNSMSNDKKQIEANLHPRYKEPFYEYHEVIMLVKPSSNQIKPYALYDIIDLKI